ncbi:phosphonate C-P lyase system protein PhnL [Desulfovibrio sp. X2]|uniref:phosphonate C-P lyase system protein PhnL n=1 Tax=Desulfovibrio sp. X2 TaxID=941449 RepID=UPI000358CE5B|nr:phosphonate C-P lyase system protein PhnL [Desulfovibrio sp. X2]EPR43819.1 phosphonate C-P lyase system protein PhnL [Desulfovibrio sp. X2]
MDAALSPDVRILAKGLSKSFVLHTQGGARIDVFSDLSLSVSAGECLALSGPSGTGKSTLLRSLYANYKPDAGSILVRHEGAFVDLASAAPREVLAVRKRTLGYVSQFLRVIPRVPALDIVAAGLCEDGLPRGEAEARARDLLQRLRIGPELLGLAPKTFSGGEQQRINIARGFARSYPILLLDEPTASLDAQNRATVVALIREAKARGAAVVGIFHDEEVRDAVADRVFTMPSRERTK